MSSYDQTPGTLNLSLQAGDDFSTPVAARGVTAPPFFVPNVIVSAGRAVAVSVSRRNDISAAVSATDIDGYVVQSGLISASAARNAVQFTARPQ